MLRHRVYRLKSKVSLLGLELSDWVVMLVSWLAFKQGLAPSLGDRLSLVVAVVGTFLFFRLWQSVKDRVPERHAAHLMIWLTEADSYRLGPDVRNMPLIVQPVLASRAAEEKTTKEVSRAQFFAEG